MKTIACLLFLLAGGGAVWLVPEVYLLRKQLDLARHETVIAVGQLDYMISRSSELAKALRDKEKALDAAQNPGASQVARVSPQSTAPQSVPSMLKPQARLAPVLLDEPAASQLAPAPVPYASDPGFPGTMTAVVADETGSAEISAELDKPAGRRR